MATIARRNAGAQTGVTQKGSLRDKPRTECKCGARRIDSQIGLEPSFTDYIETMRNVFAEVRRVLRKDGTLWLNLGDSYNSGGNPPGEDKTKRSTLQGGKATQINSRRTWDSALKSKDLCGIPWRVAFALQAPQYLGRIHNETDRAWLAALTDGEGCITILKTTSPHGSGDSYPPVLSVRMCDREMIDKAMILVGSNGDSPAQYPASMEGQRPAYQWRIHGGKAADTIAEIYPFLLIKRKQAIIAWNHQQIRENYHTKRGVKIPEDALEKQKLCCELIQKLNQKGQVDIPSWMIEPPAMFGPGWYLRSDVIWSKPNPMPESVTDRPTKVHEYLFLLTKSERYYYDAEAIKEEGANSTGGAPLKNQDKSAGPRANGNSGLSSGWDGSGSRNRRTVWEIPTAPFPEAHFATFPPALIEPCIKAGTSEKGCCAKCGAPWGRKVEKSDLRPVRGNYLGELSDERKQNGTAEVIYKAGRSMVRTDEGWSLLKRDKITLGFSPSCSCNAGTIPCTVLDPFGGAGTTGLVADRLGRNAILIELNPQYARMAERRIKSSKVDAIERKRAALNPTSSIQEVLFK